MTIFTFVNSDFIQHYTEVVCPVRSEFQRCRMLVQHQEESLCTLRGSIERVFRFLFNSEVEKMYEVSALRRKEQVEIRAQYTQDTGTHWEVVQTRSMASSRCLMVSSISLLMMVWSK